MTPDRPKPDDVVLAVTGLRVTYGAAAPVPALRGIDLSLRAGRTLAVVGESGSGKSTLATTLPMLLPVDATVTGSVRVCGTEIVGAARGTVRALRWRRVAAVIQAPGRGFNPVRTLGAQIVEPLRRHVRLGRVDALARARALAERVGLDPELLGRYPHQVSGGQAQRAMLAMALTCTPDLLVLDEPTSGLDSATTEELVELLGSLRGDGPAVLLTTHDLAVAAALADEVAVLYAGMVLERGAPARVLGDPRHPYTRDLLTAFPTLSTQKDLRPIRGEGPDPTAPPSGCPYHPRCSQAVPDCAQWAPVAESVAGRAVVCLRGGLVERLTARGVTVGYRLPGGEVVRALQDVDLTLRDGEVVGVVGPSGSGKSTLARAVLGLVTVSGGAVHWEGRPLAGLDRAGRRAFRAATGFVQQDPFDATNPRWTVAAVVGEPLTVHGHAADERAQQVRAAVQRVGLPATEAFLHRPAHDLSGGQLQRVVIARACVLAPRLLVADEPTALLDASEQARIMTVLRDLQVAEGMALLLLSHDLPLVRKVADRLLVLVDGIVVQRGPTDRVLTAPQHPAARRLVATAPRLDFTTFRSDATQSARTKENA